MRPQKYLPTASKLQLAATCAAAAALPVVDSEWAAGNAGREKHEALAAYLKGGPAEGDWLARLIEDGAVETLRGCVSEAAFAYDVVTGKARLIGVNVGREYGPRAATEFLGAADYVRVDGQRGLVVDLKTGMGEVPHPSRNLQLRFLALALAKENALTDVRVGILHAPEGRAPWWAWSELDAFGLREVEVELATLWQRIDWARKAVAKGETPRLTVGEHCTNCPSRYGCPARVAMAKRLASEPEAVVMDLKAMLTPETARVALARWKAATAALKEVGAALHAYAKEFPIPLDNGRVWGPVVSEREVIDAELALPVLTDVLGEKAAYVAMTLDTSKAGVERGVKAAKAAGALTGTIKAGVGQVLEALRKAGAVSKKSVTEYEEHDV